MKYIFSIILSILSISVSASDYQTEIDNFFKYLKEGEVEKSVNTIYSSNPYVSSIPDQIIQIQSQLSALTGLIGEINLLKKVGTYNVNDLFVHETYLVTYDRQLVRFEFQFFKVNDGWRISSFSFDTDPDDDIEALARKQALRSVN